MVAQISRCVVGCTETQRLSEPCLLVFRYARFGTSGGTEDRSAAKALIGIAFFFVAHTRNANAN